MSSLLIPYNLNEVIIANDMLLQMLNKMLQLAEIIVDTGKKGSTAYFRYIRGHAITNYKHTN